MSEASEYSAVEMLRNGREVEIRALRPDDRAGLVAAVGRTSAQSLFRRFFAAKRGFTEQEIASVVHGSGARRSEEHTSELQSRQYLVCRLLLEKKNPNHLSLSTVR